MDPRHGRWILVAALLIGAAGCPRRTANRCEGDADCPGGFVCSSGVCTVDIPDGGMSISSSSQPATSGSSAMGATSASSSGAATSSSGGTSGAASNSSTGSSSAASSSAGSSTAGSSSGVQSSSLVAPTSGLWMRDAQVVTGAARLTGGTMVMDVVAMPAAGAKTLVGGSMTLKTNNGVDP